LLLALAALPLAALPLAGCTQQSTLVDGNLNRQVLDSGQDLALSFDGTHDYATTGTAKFPDGLGTQTLSAWFELDSITGRHALLTLRKDFDSGVELGVSDGLVTAWRVFGDRTLAAATKAVSTGVWHHAAYTYDGTTPQVYVDGESVGNNSANMLDKRTPTSSWVGTLDGATDLFEGNIDDVRVFRRVLTAEELAAEAAGAPFDDTDPDLVLDLPCNEPNGAVLFDHSALANDGELGDGITQNMPKRVTAKSKPSSP
jgi:Concanavalin A-like lectin/glucanases superfamily